MAEVTVAFQVCSETINAAEAGLRKEDQHDLADMLRIVQTNEHEKLRLTLILQALQQSYSCRSFSWNSRTSESSKQAAPGTGLLRFCGLLSGCFALEQSTHSAGIGSEML